MKLASYSKIVILGGIAAALSACSARDSHEVAPPVPSIAHGSVAPHAMASHAVVVSSVRPRPRPNKKVAVIPHRPANGEVRMPIYLTGYSYWSNTPPASAAIARPVIHRQAGGTGSYRDPITIAVGHSIDGGRQTLDFPQGTRFYLAHLRKYAIVEDVCGDGPRPQDEACHIGHKGLPWLDLYVDGSKAGESTAYACAVKITSVMDAVMNPAPDYPVSIGALTETGCPTFGAPEAALQQVASLGQ